MDWILGTWAVFEKDFKLELRSRYAINMLLLFVLAALLLIAFAIGREEVGTQVQGALLWIVILFAASLGLGRTFVHEEERGTVLLLRLNVPGSMVYAGKLLFNFLLMAAVNLLAVGVFLVVLNIRVEAPGLLAVTLLLGALGLAGAMTLLGALIARAANQSALLPVLAFPLLVPLLLSVVNATRAALPLGPGWEAARTDLLVLVGFAGVVITASVLLFDYIWNA